MQMCFLQVCYTQEHESTWAAIKQTFDLPQSRRLPGMLTAAVPDEAADESVVNDFDFDTEELVTHFTT